MEKINEQKDEEGRQTEEREKKKYGNKKEYRLAKEVKKGGIIEPKDGR